jgi:hypothetical protein
MSSVRLTATVVAVAAFAFAAAGPGRADGDPASDYLLSQHVFLPFDAKIPQSEQQSLTATVAQATRSGFPIRVAVISSDYDLGSVAVLWRKPRQYARFLGIELRFAYKGRLLVVMPDGFGFNHPGHSPASENALLSRIRIAPAPAGLAQAATTAVEHLAAADGITVSARSSVPSSANGDAYSWIVIAVGVAAAVGGGLLLWLFVSRRAAARLSG